MAERIRKLVVALLAALLLLGLASCAGPSGATATPQRSAQATETPSPPPPPAITVYPADSTLNARPDSQVFVKVVHGELVDVVLRRKKDDDTAADPLPGTFSSDRSVWIAAAGLRPEATYEITATALGDSGSTPVTETASFTTQASEKKFRAAIRPADGETVGIAMPVVLTFNRPVADGYRDDVERALEVTASVPVVGSWGWVSAREIHWRPKEYWPPNTKVSLRANLTGVPADDEIWGDRNSTVAFQVTGQPVRSEVNLATHRLTVYVNGRLTKTIPITGGKAGFATRSGIKVIMEKRAHMRMRSASIGIANASNPEYYDLSDVRYAMRVTWSGEFLHAAPWSVASQGRDNVSHGCTGMSTSNAKWLFGISRVGDPVTFVGTKRGIERGNGYDDWNVDWAKWLERSAMLPPGETAPQQTR